MVTWIAYVLLGIFTISTHEITGVSINNKCDGSGCETCFDNVCYPQYFQKFKAAKTCRLAVCPKPTLSFYVWTDGCPICVSKRGFGYRNPCKVDKDCGEGSKCRKNLCTYSNVDASKLGQTCVFNNDCPAGQYCNEKGACVPGATLKHVPNVSCTFRSDCPANYFCENMICYENNGSKPDHVPGVKCIFNKDCPSGSYCQDMSCLKSDTKNGHNLNKRCYSTRDCPRGFNCKRRSCIKDDTKPQHSFDKQFCVFTSDCPRGSYCEKMSCIVDDTKPKHYPGIHCALNEECPPDHTCRRMTCYEKNRRRN